MVGCYIFELTATVITCMTFVLFLVDKVCDIGRKKNLTRNLHDYAPLFDMNTSLLRWSRELYTVFFSLIGIAKRELMWLTTVQWG